MSRDALIAAFLARQNYADARAEPLAQDASFRRYLRLTGGPRPAVLMDAPPPEDVRPFLRIAAHLAGIGLSPPQIIAADPENGLVLEEDLGDALLSRMRMTGTGMGEGIDSEAPPPSGGYGCPTSPNRFVGVLTDRFKACRVRNWNRLGQARDDTAPGCDGVCRPS